MSACEAGARQSEVLHLKKPVKDKRSSLLDPFVSYDENEVF
jgi:hypothetical protein